MKVEAQAMKVEAQVIEAQAIIETPKIEVSEVSCPLVYGSIGEYMTSHTTAY